MPAVDWQVVELKRDGFGRIERLQRGPLAIVRRVACGGGWPLSRLLAHWLMRRERAALAQLAGLPRVPQAIDDAEAAVVMGSDGCVPRRGDVLLRSWLDGVPLWQVDELASDFFDRLEELVAAMHARGVCHNDLHKENNVLVGSDGWPQLIDFQLASVHPGRGGRFGRRCREDLRHVHKHAARYAAEGQPRQGGRRSLLATLWWRCGKPVYNLITRRLLRGGGRTEPRRPRQGPWPRWRGPLQPG